MLFGPFRYVSFSDLQIHTQHLPYFDRSLFSIMELNRFHFVILSTEGGETMSKNNNIGLWTGVGLAMGAAIGAAMDNIAMGIAIGVIFGIAFGSRSTKKPPE